MQFITKKCSGKQKFQENTESIIIYDIFHRKKSLISKKIIFCI
jgi:hypothetical protein